MRDALSKRYSVGWLLPSNERDRLLVAIPPRYPDIIAHHVTMDANPIGHSPLPVAQSGEIVGENDDGAGLQTIIVYIGGTTVCSDSGVYHITWSLDRSADRKPVESNAMIARLGWRTLSNLLAKSRLR